MYYIMYIDRDKANKKQEELKMKKQPMSVLMKNAWKLAKQAANKFGGKKAEYIAETMKKAWEMKREFEGTAKKEEIKQAPKASAKNPMSFKQKKFIESLAKELRTKNIEPVDIPDFELYVTKGFYGTSAKEASDLIGILLTEKKVA